MNQYYLAAQLPSLDGIGEMMPLPITEERFCELCANSLGKKAMTALCELTLVSPKEQKTSGYKVIDEWNGNERHLRLALALARADKLNKRFDTDKGSIPSLLMQTAKTAVEISDPMEAEKFLNGFRLDFLEALRPADSFSEDAIFYYGIKLKLLSNIRKFDTEKGRTAYQNIYDSILKGDDEEVSK